MLALAVLAVGMAAEAIETLHEVALMAEAGSELLGVVFIALAAQTTELSLAIAFKAVLVAFLGNKYEVHLP